MAGEPLTAEEESKFRRRLAASNGPDDDVGYAVFADAQDAEEFAVRLLATLDEARAQAGSIDEEAERLDMYLAGTWDETEWSDSLLSEEALEVSAWLDHVMAVVPTRYETDYEMVARIGQWIEHYDRLKARATGRVRFRADPEPGSAMEFAAWGLRGEFVRSAPPAPDGR